MKYKDDCIFCKIIQKEIPTNVRYEDDNFVVIDDIEPIAPAHILIITKKPYETLEDIDQENSELHAKMLQVARKMAKTLGIQDNYKIFMNVGKRVQQVHHVHLHVYGGWSENEPITELD